MIKNILVIGGGAAGMMAAIQARLGGSNVIILEKNQALGKKILLTGGGRCNLTNTAQLNNFIDNIPENGKFLYNSFDKFFNQDLIKFFGQLGVKTKEEKDGKVFIASGKAVDIVNALERYLKKIGVKIQYDVNVKKINIENNHVKGVDLKNGTSIYGDAVILATGGASYPGTGSIGDGYKLARIAGHTITPILPSLVPLEVEESWVKELQGLSLNDIALTPIVDGKARKTFRGELLFTHFGVSGPEVLVMSRKLVEQLKGKKRVKLQLDLKPNENFEQTIQNLQKLFLTRSKKLFKNSLENILPPKLTPIFIEISKINQDKLANQISSKERHLIANLIHHFTLTISRPRTIKEAIITRGGINIKEINPRTLESKLVKNLFFAGEIIDVDGITGGYNLQIAFSTGYVAGNSSTK